jgi:hypothetical protein
MDHDAVVGFDPRSAVYYGADDQRLAGHVELDAELPSRPPVTVGA